MKTKTCRKRTVWFRSRTDRRKWHKTEKHRNGHITCFCEGFVYAGKCWHTDRAKSWA